MHNISNFNSRFIVASSLHGKDDKPSMLRGFFMKQIILLLVPLCLNAQTDTLKGATAKQNTFINITTRYGLTAAGTGYCFGFNSRYDANGNPLAPEVVLTDIANGLTTYQVLPNANSLPSMIWEKFIMDDSGNIYNGMNDYYRHVYKYNFKNGIQVTDLGTAFGNGNFTGTLAYSIRMGTDYHMYFGGTPTTAWAEYNPYTNEWVNRPTTEIDPLNDYVIDIVGTTDWVYTVVGQRNNTKRLMATNKVTLASTELHHIPASSSYQIEARTGGVYVSESSLGTYQLDNGQKIFISFARNAWPVNSGARVDKYEVGDVGQGKVKAIYDPALNTLFASYQPTYGQPLPPFTAFPIVNAYNLKNKIKLPFFDNTNANGFYFISEYYGNISYYDFATDSSTVLGSTGYNIYSVQQVNDSIFEFGGYPDGTILVWNKNRKWTAQTYNLNNATSIGTTDTTNPKIAGRFRTQTQGQFHHAKFSLNFGDWTLWGGDVIRINNTFSVGGYNYSTGQIWGYDANKIDRLSLISVAKWGNYAVLSTSNKYGGSPKGYIYDGINNTMDSFPYPTGVTTGGNVFVQGDTAVFINDKNQCFKVNLVTKQVFYQSFIGLYNANQLEHGYIGINGQTALPQGDYFIRMLGLYNAYCANDNIYSITWSGYNIVRTRNFYPLPPQQLVAKQKQFSVYPNPATTEIKIVGEGKFYLMNVQGKILKQRDGSGSIYINDLAAGIYFLNGKKIIKL